MCQNDIWFVRCRALSLHARQARKFAIGAGWQTASEWNFTDYGSQGSVSSTVIEWLNASVRHWEQHSGYEGKLPEKTPG